MFETKINGSVNSLKQHVKHKQSLVVFDDKQEIARFDDIQPLYLFPLSLSHYAKALKHKNINRLKINIISIDPNLNYIDFFNRKENLKIKNIEILVKETYSNDALQTIKNIASYAEQKKIRLTLLFENLNTITDKFLKEISKTVSFFKIMLQNIIGSREFDIFKNKLQIVKNNKKSSSLILVKAYLNETQAQLYKSAMSDFEDLNVDIFQVSKELLPLGKENPKVSTAVQKLVRNLESQFGKNAKTTFLSVKDLSILYYPRFEIDERNSRQCFACRLKPCIFNSMVLPCKVKKVMDNIETWKCSDIYGNVNNHIFELVGTTCDDCASLFENDILTKINNVLISNPKAKIKILCKKENNK